MNIVSGSNQLAAPNTQLAASWVVKVLDANSIPVPGVTVNFTDNGAGGLSLPLRSSLVRLELPQRSTPRARIRGRSPLPLQRRGSLRGNPRGKGKKGKPSRQTLKSSPPRNFCARPRTPVSRRKPQRQFQHS